MGIAEKGEIIPEVHDKETVENNVKQGSNDNLAKMLTKETVMFVDPMIGMEGITPYLFLTEVR